ncbi:MAG: type II secretion system F family protein [Woeseiaceae bacterium]
MAIEIHAERPKVPAKTGTKSVARQPINITLPTWVAGKPRVTDKERMFFTEQLSLLLETGTTLQQALQAMAGQSHGPAMKTVIENLLTNISSGKTFSQALEMHPETFSSTYTSLVAASEDGGFLDQVLLQLLQMEEKREQLRGTLVSALSYPAFLIFFSIAVVAFVLVVVFPKFGAMFTMIHDQLPATTKGLMWLSDVLRAYWVYILMSIGGTFLLARRWAASESGRNSIDRAKISIPGIRDVFVQVYLVQSLRVMSLSLSNGVSLVDTLASCKDVVKNRVFRRFFANVELKVQQGSGIAAGFRDVEMLPSLVQQMIATGEESGNLPKVMGRMADFYERELTKRLAALSKMAEPVMLLVMGLIVGIIVSSLILPIFKLSRAVG